MPKFLHIGFNFRIEPDLEELEETFDLALDWYRYAPNCWVVWTSSSPEKWYSRLQKHVDRRKKSGDTVFICELNIDERSGWMPHGFWEFVKSHQRTHEPNK
jgi:hypothetical protein